MATISISKDFRPSSPIEVADLLRRKLTEWGSRQGLWAILHRYGEDEWDFILWDPKKNKDGGSFPEKIQLALSKYHKAMDAYVAHLNRLDDKWDNERLRLAATPPRGVGTSLPSSRASRERKVGADATVTEENGRGFHSRSGKSGVMAVIGAGIVVIATALAGLDLDTANDNAGGGFLCAKNYHVVKSLHCECSVQHTGE